MVASVSELLDAAAEIQAICASFGESLTNNQETFVIKIVDCTELFSKRANEMKAALERDNSQNSAMHFELRAPVVAVCSFTKLMLLHQSTLGFVTDSQHEKVAHLHEAAQNLSALVDELFNNAAPRPDV